MRLKEWIYGIGLAGMLMGSINSSSAQNVVFGLSYRPLIPNSLFTGENIDFQTDTLSVNVSNKFGNSFGMVIRTDFTERWSLETGIHQTRRNFWIEAEGVDTALSTRFDLGMVTYEIPIQLLYYVRLSDQVYMNAMAGISINFFPTNHSKVSPDFQFLAQSLRREWVGGALVANVGFEYRTERSGYFYLGASLNRSLLPISTMAVAFNFQPYNISVARANLPGHYLTLDLRYFFKAEKKEKRKKKRD